jgi:hypothetical protein
MSGGVVWRGRVWRISGAAEDGESGGEGELSTAEALAAARAEGAREAATAAAEREVALQARIAELESAHGQTSAELEASRQATAAATERGLTAHRRALIAEQGAAAVQELIQGASEEALDASVEVAKAAFARIQEQLQAGAAAAVPAGAGARTGQDVDGLSSLAKIARGLKT